MDAHDSAADAADIRYRVFEELSWNEVAISYGTEGHATAVRMSIPIL